MTGERKLHIAKSGVAEGKWVTCTAEKNCRNGGMHITSTEMTAITKQLTKLLGRTITVKNADPTLVLLVQHQKEKETDQKDQLADENGIDLTASRMDEATRKAALKSLNQLSGGRARTFDKAQENIITAYENLPPETVSLEQLNKALYQEITGLPPKDDFNWAHHQTLTTVNRGKDGVFLVIDDSTTVDDEEGYNAFVEKINMSQRTPDSMQIPSFEDIYEDYLSNSDEEDQYYDYDPEYLVRIVRYYKLNDEETDRYKASATKTGLADLYPIAKNENIPSWALNPNVRGYNNRVVDTTLMKVKRIEEKRSQDKRKLEKNLKAVQKASESHAKLSIQKRHLEDEVAKAREVSLNAQEPVVAEALQDYITSKTKTIKELEPKIRAAETKGSNEALTKAQKAYDEYVNQKEPQEVEKVWKEAVLSWLSSKFPAKNGTHRNSEATKWLKTHPEAIQDIRKYLQAKQK